MKFQIGDRVYCASHNTTGTIEIVHSKDAVYVRWDEPIRYGKMCVTAEVMPTSMITTMNKPSDPNWINIWEASAR